MAEFIPKLINLSIAAGLLVPVVLIVRLLLKKAPRRAVCLLWAVVALRLLLPFSPQSPVSAFSLLRGVEKGGSMEYVAYSGHSEKPNLLFDTVTISQTPDPAGEKAAVITRESHSLYIPAVFSVWLLALSAMLLYAAASVIILRLRLREAVKTEGRVYECAVPGAPFVFGILRPRIYLPFGLSDAARAYVLAHENAHLRRADHIWKLLAFLLLSVHWFNPLLWIAFFVFCRDVELACDEYVIRSLSARDRADYSEALLLCSAPRRSIALSPLCFGEVSVKKRVDNVLTYKKPAYWAIAGAILALIVMALCFLTAPASSAADADEAALPPDTPAASEQSIIEDAARAELSMGEWYGGELPEYYCDAAAFLELDAEGNEHYGVVLYRRYDRELNAVSEFLIYCAATVENSAVTEFWMPGDGAYHDMDIAERFPQELADAILKGDAVKDYDELKAILAPRCDENALKTENG